MPSTTRPKVLIGLPTMASVHTLLLVTILSWMHDAFNKGVYNLSLYPTINEQPVDNARNHIVKELLASDCSHLLFIDSDTVPPQDAIEKMLTHDKLIVSALTPIIEYDEQKGDYYRKWNCVGEDDKHMQPNTGLRLCKGAGASCILIKREVFEQLKEPWYQFLKKDDNGKEITVSEDIYFVVNALSKGIQTYADTSIICQHYKPALW